MCPLPHRDSRRATRWQPTAPRYRRIAQRDFSVSRFHLDPQIPDEVARTIKRDWVDNFFAGARGDRMLVVERSRGRDRIRAGTRYRRGVGHRPHRRSSCRAGAGRWNRARQWPDCLPARASGTGRDPGLEHRGDALLRASRVHRRARPVRPSPPRLMRLGPVDTARAGRDRRGDRQQPRGRSCGGSRARAGRRRRRRACGQVSGNRARRCLSILAIPPESPSSSASGFPPMSLPSSLSSPARSASVSPARRSRSRRSIGSRPLVDAFKIASGDNDYTALLQRVGGTGKPVIVSSGMTDTAGLKNAQQTRRTGRVRGSSRPCTV